MYTAQLYASCSYMVVTEKIDGRGDDDEQDLDGQACKGRALHHQGGVGRLWVGGALARWAAVG